MEETEKAVEKRMFTTDNIQQKIIKNIKNLPGINWHFQQYNYLYVVHKIISHINLYKGETLGCKINVKYLSTLFGKPNQQTAEILKNLQNWNIIYKSVPAAHKISARYQLHSEHSDDNVIMFNVSNSDAAFIDKIIRFKKVEVEDKFILKTLNLMKSSLSVNSYGYDYLYNKYNSFVSKDNRLLLDGYADLKSVFLISEATVLTQKSEKKTTGGYGIERRDIPLFLILIKEFFCKRPQDRNGNKSRVYNNLTNLPREHRQYVHFCNKPLLMTDISNSQILLTVPLIEKYYKIYSGKGVMGMPEDILRFRNWAESGEFYEKFSKLIYHNNDITSEQRKELKQMIFRILWFGRNTRFKNTNRVKSEFIKHFPNVFEIITALKQDDYKQFSIELQRFEASIIVDTVASKMLSKYRVLTLHDAIICTDEDTLSEVEIRIAKALAKYNLIPKFKRENERLCTTRLMHHESINNEIKLSVPERAERRSNREIKPIEKKIYPVDEEYLAASRKYFASLTKQQIINHYEKYEGKKFPKKYMKWVENR